jgi:hypothetical protein
MDAGFANSASLWQPLDEITEEIRILHLHPSTDRSSSVRADLVIVSLLDKPEYDALSYCWGDSEQRAEITLSGTQVSVTKNLGDALCALRTHSGIRKV